MQAPPLLGRAFRNIMKIGRALIGFIIFYVPCLFIIINDVYLQECLAAFILRVKMYRYRGRGGLLKFSILMYCGSGLFILKVE